MIWQFIINGLITGILYSLLAIGFAMVLLPRLVASITASWITLSMGFDLYVAFFDSKPAVPTIIVLLAILFFRNVRD